MLSNIRNAVLASLVVLAVMASGALAAPLKPIHIEYNGTAAQNETVAERGLKPNPPKTEDPDAFVEAARARDAAAGVVDVGGPWERSMCDLDHVFEGGKHFDELGAEGKFYVWCLCNPLTRCVV
ncbi:hypothetical protein PG985_010558 [Apiospora marii]|uniref:Uncharacterized protein n=1 Tax=Apiospora marii TaxID=335849 RepID=A0ABR1T2S7_9PEZI